MKVSHLLLAACLALAPMTAPVMAQTSQTYTFVFREADIGQVADEILGAGLGVSYRVEPGVSGKMNFSIEQRLTKVQLLAAFEQALAQYDVVMIQDGETVVLRPRKLAGVGGQVTTARASGIGFQVRAVPINYGSATEIAKALGAIARADMVLFSSDKLGLIILGGRAEELDNALTTIGLFDQSTLSDARIRFYPLANASAASVGADLELLLKASGTSGVTIAPMRRLNGIFAFSQSQEALSQIGSLVQRLDVPSQDTTIRVWVYHPQGASAENLVKTLNAVVGTMSDVQVPAGSATSTGEAAAPAGTSSAPESNSQGVRIVADKATNTVIINAPEATRVRLQEVLSEIDREPAQVFIEASIVEVTLTKDLSYGVDWEAIASNGDLSVSHFSTRSTGFGQIAPGFSINYLGNDISAAVTALSSQSKVRIVSAPKVATVENMPAVLQVGDQVPVVTQTAQSVVNGDAPVVNSVDYRDTGVMLKVTPRITGTNRILLEVSQEVSSVARTQTSGIDSPTINQRKLDSSLIVPEGTVVALGGLISSSDSQSDSGIPGLKDIPLIGGVFKGQSHNRNRTELIVLLKARILRSPSDYDAMTASLGADLRELIQEGFLAPAGPAQ
ncbi:general secretion pathway protein D [Asticcacaulis biprosthecium C19]|uniref:General secretion pathway protein D n=1 Tax=Asticcacaulis biprosthecium C19 TaxID=715226 RepID=F4QHZ3_9CAUL|nr:type II secretion system secretin GspD [Asticcacaulis biprosthecium]EGF92860.1 general secretion pathway protein D [Asticcacaulis biprosthecium C19]